MVKNNKIDIITLGCSKNLVDSEKLMKQLIANGYCVSFSYDRFSFSGSIVIINTCGFIGDAKKESVQMILNFVQARKKNQIKKLFVMGCLSERYSKELQNLIPEVDKFYGKFNWKELIIDLGKTYYHALSEERILTTPGHYAYIKIAEGCNRTCSYCSIPLITGRYCSRSIKEIEYEVKSLVRQGVREFQIIAQDLTYYGMDLNKTCRLPELIDCLSKIDGVEWIRLHYAYPANFPLSLLKIMRDNKNVCSYLDIALQHSSNAILKKMRRNITQEEIYQLISIIRKEVPNIHIRTTMMVGHPGETEKDFKNLLFFIRKIRFERLGAFVYSEEDGTYSAIHYKDEISENVKQQRICKLMQVQKVIAQQINKTKIGQTMKVVVDREGLEFYVGRTEYDSPKIDPEVLIKKNKKLNIGNFYFAKIVGTQSFDLLAEV